MFVYGFSVVSVVGFRAHSPLQKNFAVLTLEGREAFFKNDQCKAQESQAKNTARMQERHSHSSADAPQS